MKRYKVGDVFSFKTENGYRILLWAYRIEKFGDYVRVLPGFYDSIPDNALDIALGECSFIMSTWMTRISKTILTYIGSVNVSDIPKMPEYQINYSDYGKTGRYEVSEFKCAQRFFVYEGPPDSSCLPEQFREINLVNGSVDLVWFIYLLTEGFDNKHWDLLYPGKRKYEAYWEKYNKLI